ncbi:hypothetical protein STEG23_000152 [Scotinomys teguina]
MVGWPRLRSRGPGVPEGSVPSYITIPENRTQSTADMAAESLPFTLEAASSWELEAWYEDLQEVLSSDDNGGPYISSPGNGEEESKTLTTLDPASLAWLTEEPGPAEVTSTSQSPRSPDSSQSCMAQEGEEEGGRSRKRRRSGECPARAGKQRMKEKEQENERKVAQLAQENERLKQEIERLSREVEATRRALIDRMVNLHQA